MPATSAIPEFTNAENKLVAQTLSERYADEVALEAVEVELQIDPASPVHTACPALYWQYETIEFIVCKLAAGRFACSFFNEDGEQFGTGRRDYDNLGDCVVSLLQVQAQHEQRLSDRNGRGNKPAPAGNQDGNGADGYSGPIVI